MEEFEDLLADVLEESFVVVRLLNGSFPGVAEDLKAIDDRLLALTHDSVDFATKRMTTLQYLCGDDFFRMDAQIVYRTYVECLTRLIYVLTHSREEVTGTILPEMYDDLHELQFLRASINVQPLLRERETAPDRDKNLWSGAALPPSEEERLRKRLGKKERSRLNQKYSFSEMAKKIAGSDPSLSAFTGILHTYNQASHVAHADLLGLALDVDFESRDERSKALMSFAHRAGVISDAVSFLLLTYRLIYRFVGKKLDVTEVIARLNVVYKATRTIGDAFYETQAHLYETDTSPI